MRGSADNILHDMDIHSISSSWIWVLWQERCPCPMDTVHHPESESQWLVEFELFNFIRFYSSPNPLKHHQLYTFTQLMVPSLLILTWLSFSSVTKIHVTPQTPGVTSWPFADTQTLNPGSEINHGKQQFLRPRVGFMSSISHNYYLSDPCKNPNRQESVWMLGRPWPWRWPVPALHLSFHLRAFRQGQHHKIIQEGQKLD